MTEFSMLLIGATLIGAGATAFMDATAIARKRLFGTPSANYALVGRWLAFVSHGKFRVDVQSTAAVPQEALIGWSAHYLTGIVFALALLVWQGLAWLSSPTLLPALTVGAVTVLAPFLIMQPGMGAGIAASRTPRPALARRRSVITHLLFGLGLYIAGLVLRVVHAQLGVT